ncbi:MAG: DUF1552 domain-containing protein [Phycisphaerales bacterium]
MPSRYSSSRARSWVPTCAASRPACATAPSRIDRRERARAAALGDGPGDHARSAACFLTGAHPHKTAGDDIRAGQSVDQAIADALERQGRRTRLRSLDLGAEPAMTAGNCDSGYSCAYSANISWKSERLPNGKETDPRAAFDRVFGRRGETPEEAAARARSRRSILDGAVAQAPMRSRSRRSGRTRTRRAPAAPRARRRRPSPRAPGFRAAPSRQATAAR